MVKIWNLVRVCTVDGRGRETVEIHVRCITVNPRWCCFAAVNYSILFKFGRLMHHGSSNYSR